MAVHESVSWLGERLCMVGVQGAQSCVRVQGRSCVYVHALCVPEVDSVRYCRLCVCVQGTMSRVCVQAVPPGVSGGGDSVLCVCVQGAVRMEWCMVCVCEGHRVCSGDSAAWRVAVAAAGARARGCPALQERGPWLLRLPLALGMEWSCCPQGPVPAELLTWGKRLGDPSPLPALLPTSKAVGRSPLGPAQIDKDFSLSWRWWPAPLAVR